ncbi:MBL fold metallo-hydrolase [Desulfolithobacter dissulfuricans]|uniref:MBL fold metallo-hydrolase n=1 Tax=Desulfolithobacter dissulfuricans TaxID=2795293 RepID=A0A915TZ95_9BACT|nr:MBL fold metallo-hydrolase [Desulfolithobacter dissulfuricans]BCO07980.1 MBL fold metallo-hydrolase [Desulfolithobacter dissulfuricans]
MEVLFLGVGEACDEHHANTSVLLTTGDGCRILLDCGFTAAHRLFAHCRSAEEPHAVWISHFHGDHFFGIPLLLLRLWETGRTEPLTIISLQGGRDKVLAALELAYPGFEAKLQFPLIFKELDPGARLEFGGLTWQAARSIHSCTNLGLLLQDDRHRLFYSGDGRPTPETEQLMQGADLVIHEAFSLKDSIANHGSVLSCLDLARRADIGHMALVHLERNVRTGGAEVITTLLSEYPRIWLPTEDDRILLGDTPDLVPAR